MNQEYTSETYLTENISFLFEDLIYSPNLIEKAQNWDKWEEFSTLIRNSRNVTKEGEVVYKYTNKKYKSDQNINFREYAQSFREHLEIEEDLERIESNIFNNTEGISYRKKDILTELEISKKIADLTLEEKDLCKKAGIKHAVNLIILTSLFDCIKVHEISQNIEDVNKSKYIQEIIESRINTLKIIQQRFKHRQKWFTMSKEQKKANKKPNSKSWCMPEEYIIAILKSLQK